MRFFSAALLGALGVLGVAGCGSTAAPIQPGIEQDVGSTEDATPPSDGGVPATDAVTADVTADVPVVDAFVSSGCPVPAKITPTDVPAGYLPAQRANLGYTVDGDTAHFHTTAGEIVVRFLFVNTEETSGAERTAFGETTKAAVDAVLKGTTDITLRIRQGSSAGSPDKDPFGRLLGLVFVDGELLQTRIVREGWCPYYTAYGCAPAPIHAALLHAEAEANANDRGIWKPGHPTDYKKVLTDWIGTSTCRPNPYNAPYCK